MMMMILANVVRYIYLCVQFSSAAR